MILNFAVLILMLVAGLAIFLYFYQGRMIYLPPRFAASDHDALQNVRVLEYTTSQGRQFAYYVPPADNAERAPQKLWVLFGGNRTIALFWLSLIQSPPPSDVGYLLVDYPGYGACEGTPTRSNILESQVKVLPELAKALDVPVEELQRDINTMGYSLGAATSLDFAVTQPVKRVILLAPFTSMMDMAHRQVGTPLKYVLRDRYDNRARLNELAAMQPPPRITILHGNTDEIINYRMGEELAALHPGITTYHTIAKCDHNSLLEHGRNEILTAMNE